MRPDVVVRTLTARGLLGLELPHRRARQLLALQRWGYGIAGELRAAAAVSGSRVALIDERGAHTYSEAVDLGDRLARVLRSRGLPAGARVGLLAPNGVEFVLALYAANLLGIDLVLLNTGLTGERITQIADRDDLQTVLHDGELAHLVGGVAAAYDLGELMTQARDAAYAPSGGRLAPAREEGRTIVLTSGTTGVPKGAPRRAVGGIGAIVSILERIPLHHRDRILLSAPLFHTWGFAGLQLAFGVQATVILQRRFEPARAQAALAEHRAQVLFAVPAMLQRLLAWREAVPEAGMPHLRVVASSGSKFPPGFATRFLDEFGEVLYSLYGSTEVSWATIATPEHLRRDPDTAGTPPLGTRLALLDADRQPVPDGEIGHFYVGNDMVFDGYLDGSTRDQHAGVIAIGDLGWRRMGCISLRDGPISSSSPVARMSIRRNWRTRCIPCPASPRRPRSRSPADPGPRGSARTFPPSATSCRFASQHSRCEPLPSRPKLSLSPSPERLPPDLTLPPSPNALRWAACGAGAGCHTPRIGFARE